MPIELMPITPIVMAMWRYDERPDDQARADRGLRAGAEARPDRGIEPDRGDAEQERNRDKHRDLIARHRRQVTRGKFLIHLCPGDWHVQDELADVHDQARRHPAFQHTDDVDLAHVSPTR